MSCSAKYSPERLFASVHPDALWEDASADQKTFYEKKSYICETYERAIDRMTAGSDVLGLDDTAVYTAMACLKALETGGFLLH